MLNLSTLNVCARATCGPATLIARRTAGIGSEYFVIGSPGWMQVARPRGSQCGLGVCRRANEIYLPRASEADRASSCSESSRYDSIVSMAPVSYTHLRAHE